MSKKIVQVLEKLLMIIFEAVPVGPLEIRAPPNS